MISVLTPTYRLLYRDRQLKALSQQTFKDFEWIIIDDSYEQNKGIKAPFPIIHIPPINPVPYFALASAINDGIVQSSGKYVFFMNDYIIPEKHCLERHWEVQERMKGCLLSGRALAMDDVPSECKDANGKIIARDYRMALFEKGIFNWTPLNDDLYEVSREGIQNWWAGRNDSCPLEVLLNCNGFDEAFDGRWGGQDADMANRLMTYGLKYYIDKKSVCMEYKHPRGNKKEVRTEAQQRSFQYSIINPKVEAGVCTANTTWFVMIPRNMKEEWDARKHL